MEEKNKKDINRRDFIKIVGISAATSTAILYGCSSKGTSSSSSASAEGEIPTDKMTYRTSPTTGDRVSLLGYGCMRWPLKPAPDGKGEVIDQDAVNGLIDYAIAHGVNYFDTSPAYVQGFSEKSTGIALSRYPRDKYFIATKLSNFSPDTWSREASLKMYHKSFADLQVDYIDYMLLHGIGMGGMDALKGRYLDNGMLDFLIKEREAGRIRNLGFSYHGDIEVYDYLLSRHDEIKWDFVQIQLNYVDWKHAKETNARNTDAEYLYGELHKRGIPSIIMEPLLGGRLSKLNDNLVARLKQRRPESSVASWAFRFAGTFPDILTVLSGMTYMEHLQDNLRTYSPLEPLTDEEMDFLEDTAQLMLKYPTIPCNDCKYCMPCPYGLDIPAVLLHYNRCVNEGNVPKNGQDENYLKARRAFLVGYDRSVPKLRQASHCIGCNQCVPHCPQNIDIPKELHRIDQFVEQLKQGNLIMEELINLLHSGGYSCVIANGDNIRTFTQRGVADLYDLLTQEPDFLKGASIADKVVGKGAAALMILGGIRELHTDIISSKALDLLRSSDIKVHFVQEVPFIWNRDHTGWCPVETMCSEEESAEAILPLIRDFLEKIRSGKKLQEK